MAATSGTDHLVRHANPAFCRLVGREWNVVVGHSLASSLPKTRRARTLTLLDRVYSTGVAERTGN
ncbi:MAG: PAS domain-containing protein, partial [Chloroflexi bacterium]|nr:PAS domain-containing protein [Chloroflexota bacterium]